MKVVAGLGNPGKKYAKTPHNVGFDVVDELARRGGATFGKGWLSSAQLCKMSLMDEAVLLVKPQTYMNNSGDAVARVLRKRGVEPGVLVVVLDDVELPFGRVRIRRKGGAGGHKGLKSIIQHLGTDEFARVRLGIGPRPPGEELVEHVLTRFTAEEQRAMKEAVERAADAIACIVERGVEEAMNRFN